MRNELFNLTLLSAPLPASMDCRTCKPRVLVWMGRGPPGAAWHGAGGSLGGEDEQMLGRRAADVPRCPRPVQPVRSEVRRGGRLCLGRQHLLLRAGREPEVSSWRHIWGGLLPAPGCPHVPAPPGLEIPSHEPAPGQTQRRVPPPGSELPPCAPGSWGAGQHWRGQRGGTGRRGHCRARRREHGGTERDKTPLQGIFPLKMTISAGSACLQ